MTTLTVTDIDPPMPTAEEMEACNRRSRESVALWMHNDDYFESQLLWEEIIAEVVQPRYSRMADSVAPCHGVRGGVLHQYHHWFGRHRLDHCHVAFQQE
jgi:hypothetical protein